MGPYVLRSIAAHYKLWDEGAQDSFEENLKQAPVSDIPGISTDCNCWYKDSGCEGSAIGGTGSCSPGQDVQILTCSPTSPLGCDPRPSFICQNDNNCCTTYYPQGCGKTPIGQPPSTGDCNYGQRIYATQCSNLPVECKTDASCNPQCVGTATANAQPCPNATTGLNQNYGIQLVANLAACPQNPPPYCEYYCPSPFIINQNGNACIAPSPYWVSGLSSGDSNNSVCTDLWITPDTHVMPSPVTLPNECLTLNYTSTPFNFNFSGSSHHYGYLCNVPSGLGCGNCGSTWQTCPAVANFSITGTGAASGDSTGEISCAMSQCQNANSGSAMLLNGTFTLNQSGPHTITINGSIMGGSGNWCGFGFGNCYGGGVTLLIYDLSSPTSTYGQTTYPYVAGTLPPTAAGTVQVIAPTSSCGTGNYWQCYNNVGTCYTLGCIASTGQSNGPYSAQDCGRGCPGNHNCMANYFDCKNEDPCNQVSCLEGFIPPALNSQPSNWMVIDCPSSETWNPTTESCS